MVQKRKRSDLQSKPPQAEAEKAKFFELADKLNTTSDPAERKRIKEILARMTFGK